MKKCLLLAVALLLVVLGVPVASASAATALVRVGAFAEQGPDGSARHQGRIAVNYDTGDVYVADQQNDRVAVYRQNGTGADLLTSFGAGALTDPYGIAIDQDDGSVYISDADGVTKYDSNGAATPAFTVDAGFASITATGPLAFDQAANTLLLGDTTANIVRRYSAAGVSGATFDGTGSPDTFGTGSAFTLLQDLAVDSTGDVIVIDAAADPGTGGTTRIERFSSAGAWEATIGPVDQAATVGVYPGNDDVVIGGNQDGVDANEWPTLRRFSAAGADLGAIPADGAIQYSTTTGIAADDGATGRLHIATDVSAGGYVGSYGLTSIQNYDELEVATLGVTAATDVAPFSATLHGTVNPEGAGTTYRFEVSSDGGSTWTTVDQDGDGDESAGGGTSDVAVSQSATGLTENTNYQYRLVAHRGIAPSTSATESFTTTDATDPTATIAPTTDIQGSSATFNGTVNPNGGPGETRYHFEYSADEGASWTSTAEQNAGDGTTDVAAAATATALLPLTSYRVRLVATKGSISAISSEDIFTSPAIAPTVSTGAATAGEETTKLRGAVNPNGAPTSFWFEYGLTTSYGSSAPVSEDANAGAGRDNRAVLRGVAGLSPNTVYHYRLVAKNETGTSVGDDRTVTTVAGPPPPAAVACPNAAVRVQQHSQRLPDCRAYEQVSPVDKGGSSVLFLPNTGIGVSAISGDGSRVAFNSYGVFADSTTGQAGTYVASRGAGGWTAQIATPPSLTANPSITGGDAVSWGMAARDLRTGAVLTTARFVARDTNRHYDAYSFVLGGSADRASEGNNGEQVPARTPYDGVLGTDYPAISGLSDDGRALAFTFKGPLVPEDVGGTVGHNLYVRKAGRTRRVNQATDGSVLNTCGASLGSYQNFLVGTADNAIANDGSQVIFSVPTLGQTALPTPDCFAPPRIYASQESGETIEVSASQRATPDPGGPMEARYLGASVDGKRVIFFSRAMLTDDAQPDADHVYSFDVPSRTLRVAIQADGLSVVRVADDGKRIVFAGSPSLDPDAPPVPGKPSEVYLYTAEPDRIQRMFASSGVDMDSRAVIFGANGSVAFTRVAGDLTDFEAGNFLEVFLWRPDRPLTCVSCDPAGQRPGQGDLIGDAGLAKPEGDWQSQLALQGFDATGERLVFQARDRLVPGDTNDRTDVYEFANERLALISNGQGRQASYLVGISDDGASIAFSTADGLVGADTDGNVDMYVARIDGGFLEPGPQGPVACTGEACQPSASTAPAAAAAGTVTFAGPGNTVGRSKAPAATRKVTANVRTTIRGTSATLKVKVPGKGRLRVSGSGLTPTTRTVGRAGTYGVTLKLSQRARRSLARGQRVRVRVAVRFVPAQGKSSSVNVKTTFAPAAQGRRSSAATSASSSVSRKGL
jgi:hypothetical protein